jgi:hypothetical protein
LTLPASSQTQKGAFGKLKHAHFDWEPGFRANASYRFEPDFWDLEAEYTWYRTDGSSRISTPTDKTINGTYPQDFSFFADISLFKAKSHISLRYQTGDLLLGRRFLATDHLILHLQTGLTGAWFKQRWRFVYQNDGGSPAFVGTFPVKDLYHNNWSFNGAGLKAKGNGDWFIAKGWSLKSEIGAAILYGRYRNRLSEKVITTVPGVINHTDINTRERDHRFVETLQLALGPSWSTMREKGGLRIFALYELNAWFNVQQVNRSDLIQVFPDQQLRSKESRHSNGVLGLHGLTLGAEFDF